jgi:hypothetical protein
MCLSTGSGADADSITLSLPDRATLGMLVLGLLGAGFSGRKRRGN